MLNELHVGQHATVDTDFMVFVKRTAGQIAHGAAPTRGNGDD
jgi:hypothetical protein